MKNQSFDNSKTTSGANLMWLQWKMFNVQLRTHNNVLVCTYVYFTADEQGHISAPGYESRAAALTNTNQQTATH